MNLSYGGNNSYERPGGTKKDVRRTNLKDVILSSIVLKPMRRKTIERQYVERQ